MNPKIPSTSLMSLATLIALALGGCAPRASDSSLASAAPTNRIIALPSHPGVQDPDMLAYGYVSGSSEVAWALGFTELDAPGRMAEALKAIGEGPQVAEIVTTEATLPSDLSATNDLATLLKRREDSATYQAVYMREKDAYMRSLAGDLGQYLATDLTAQRLETSFAQFGDALAAATSATGPSSAGLALAGARGTPDGSVQVFQAAAARATSAQLDVLSQALPAAIAAADADAYGRALRDLEPLLSDPASDVRAKAQSILSATHQQGLLRGQALEQVLATLLATAGVAMDGFDFDERLVLNQLSLLATAASDRTVPAMGVALIFGDVAAGSVSIETEPGEVLAHVRAGDAAWLTARLGEFWGVASTDVGGRVAALETPPAAP